MIKVDLEKARELLAQAVADKGADYVYNEGDVGAPCFYADQNDDSKPGCIVGHALKYLDEGAFEAAVDFDAENRATGEDTNAHALTYHLENILELVEFDGDAISYLSHAQQLQDSGTPWGESVQGAEDYVA